MVKARAAKKKLVPIGFGCGEMGEPTLYVPGFTTRQYGSAWVAHNSESTIVVTMMGLQDLRTAWSVTMVDISGATVSEYGLTKPEKEPVKKVNKVLRRLARSYLPKEAKPTEVEVDEDKLGFGIAM